MSRLLNIIVNTCEDCPFCQYEGYYDRSHDSGWDCNHEDGPSRLVDDWELSNYNSKLDEWVSSKDTLFPLPLKEKPQNPFNIPAACPLGKVEEPPRECSGGFNEVH